MTNIMSIPRAFQRAIDEVRMLPLSPERMAQKRFFRFLSESQLQSNKVCYKVPLGLFSLAKLLLY